MYFCSAKPKGRNKVRDKIFNTMRKQHLVLLCICLLTHSIFSQPIDYKIRLSATTVAATCQGNGEIHCSISYDPRLDIEQVRYYYIPLSGLDSIVETSLSDVTHLRPGDYKIRVSALCHTGLSGEDANIILTDSINSLTVTSVYSIPHSWMVYNIYAFSTPYGIVPSLTCAPTGKIQVKIQQGTFPYHLVVWKITPSDTLLYRTITFDTNLYHGDDSTRFDFKDYYTLDSMEIGTYRILCSDGCGYYMPYLQVSVPKVNHYNSPNFHLLRNSSGFPESQNIITFKEISVKQSFAGHNDDYYRDYATGQNTLYYRFINPTLSTENDTTPWWPVPAFNESVFLYDTLNQLHDYGQVWGRNIILQFQPYCQDTLFSYSYTIHSHGSNLIYLGQSTENYMQEPSVYTYCWHRNMSYEYDAINEAIVCEHVKKQCYNMPDSIDCQNYYGYTIADLNMPSTVGVNYHSYITFPLKGTVVNMTSDTLVFSGELPGREYIWRHRFLEHEDFHNDSLLLTITDANDNPLISNMIRYRRVDAHHQFGGQLLWHTWTSWNQDLDGDYFCPEHPHHLGIYQRNGLVNTTIIGGERHYIYEKDTICIVESPDGNKYNLSAIAGPDGEWVVNKLRTDNHATLKKHLFVEKGTNTRYPGVLLTDTNLAPGRYVWIVYKPCETNDTIIQYVQYDIPEIKEYPEYIFDTTCTALNITPIKGQYAKGEQEVETFFQVYSTDTLIHTASATHKNGTLSIGIPGRYKIGMYALPHDNEMLITQNPCFIVDTTIEWNNETVKLDYIYGHVCNEEDDEGFVRVKGKYGLKPYTYTLFSNAGGEGTVLSANSTGVFDHVPVHFGQRVSVEIRDACNAHFITDLTISDMDKIRKCWTSDNLNSVVMEPVDTCYLFGLSLGGVSYHWSGPNGFDCNTQNAIAVIEDLSNAGTYRISIEGGGCGILHDSVIVRVQERPCPQAVDYDGIIYNATRINGLCWTQSNLRSEHYSDGRPVDTLYVYDHPDFTREQMIETFGILYRWADAADSGNFHYVDVEQHVQGICPEGWYLPTNEQYEALGAWGADALRSPEYWINNAGGSNITGFSALPAGFYNGRRERFENLFGETRFWSINPDIFSENQYSENLTFFCSDLMIQIKNASDAYSVRCVLAE